MSQNHVSKISVKSVYGEVEGMEKGEPEKPIMRVMGICVKAVHGESDKGPWTAFEGDFAAINAESGEIFRSARCFLPNVATNQLAVALEQSTGPVEFALDIAVRPSNNVHKYEYFAKTLKDMSATDPLAGLLDNYGGGAPGMEQKPEIAPAVTATVKPAPAVAATVKPVTAKAKK